jgi:hypothetical protein
VRIGSTTKERNPYRNGAANIWRLWEDWESLSCVRNRKSPGIIGNTKGERMSETPENIISLSERLERAKKRAADIECRLPQEESKRFREEYERLLEKLEDHIDHTRTKFGVY